MATRRGADPLVAMRAAIWQAPDDEDLKSVYVDALLENAPPLGELFSLLRQGKWGARSRRLKRELKESLLGAARPYVNSWDIDDVFVTSVTCEGTNFVEGFEALAALSPRLSVKLWLKSGRRRLAGRMSKLKLSRMISVRSGGRWPV